MKVNWRAIPVTGIIFCALFAIQFLKVNKLLPLDLVLNEHPITTDGYGGTYAAVLRDEAFRKTSHPTWGYDPYHMAGYLANVIVDSDRRFCRLVCQFGDVLFPPQNSIKIYIFVVLLLLPVLLYFSGKNFFNDEKTALLSFAVGIAAFMGYEPLMITMVREGYHDYLLGLFWSAFALSAFYRFLLGPKKNQFLIFAASFLMLALINVLVFFLFLPVFGFFYFLLPSHLDRRKSLSLGAVFFLSLLLVAPPVCQFFQFKDQLVKIPSPPFTWITLFHYYSINFSVGPRLAFQAMVRVAALILTVLAMVVLFRRDKKLGLAFALWVGWITLILAVGSRLSWLNSLDKSRWMAAAIVWQLIVLGFFLSTPFFFKNDLRVLILAAVLWHLMTWNMNSAALLRPLKVYLETGPDSLLTQLQKLPSRGRILWEADWGDSEIIGAIPYYLHREMIGTPGPFLPLAAYWNTGFFMRNQYFPPVLFGRTLSSYDSDMLKAALTRNNVTYVVAFSLSARYFFDHHPDVLKSVHGATIVETDDRGWPKKVKSAHSGRTLSIATPFSPLAREKFRIYRVLTKSSGEFFQGSGVLQAKFNEILISQPSVGDVVLKYHWYRTLKCSPGATLKPVEVPPDLIPFIGLSIPSQVKSIKIGE